MGTERAQEIEKITMSLGEGGDLDALVENCLTGL